MACEPGSLVIQGLSLFSSEKFKLSVELNFYNILGLGLAAANRETLLPLPALLADITNQSCPLFYLAQLGS